MSKGPDKRLWVGHCWLCGAPCFEVVRVWTTEPAAGQPRQLGPPLAGAKRVTMVRLRSGRLTDITLCDACEPTPDRIVELNGLLCLRDRIEGSPWWNEAVGRDEESHATKLRKARVSVLYHADPVIGELSRRAWQEVL